MSKKKKKEMVTQDDEDELAQFAKYNNGYGSFIDEDNKVTNE